LGQFTLGGGSGFWMPPGRSGLPSSQLYEGSGPWAVGMSLAPKPESHVPNPKLASDPALRTRVSIRPQLSYRPPAPEEGTSVVPEPKVTTADLLEALHRATGLPIVADFYTRLYKPDAVSLKNRSLLAALDELAETTRIRWDKEGAWLQFRSATYYHDRLKEVPSRLLSRWAAARRQQGQLSLDNLVEIAQLSDSQLDGTEMAEGAMEYWGLKEWRLARDRTVRSHLRDLAAFTADQRQQMMSAAGLPFTRMSLPQQQKFIARAFENDNKALQSLDELSGATLRVDYTHPGWYQWRKPGDFRSIRWAVQVAPRPNGRRVLMPPIRERTREAALREARRAFPPVTEAMLQAYRQLGPDAEETKLIPQEAQIFPTELDLVIVYISGASTAHGIHWVRPHQNLGGE
jgi:hypothetical protein